MIIDISEDGRTIEWWSNGERKIATIDHLIDTYDRIVRCKDCKWIDLCKDPEFYEYKGANGFCSKGERKESEE